MPNSFHNNNRSKQSKFRKSSRFPVDVIKPSMHGKEWTQEEETLLLKLASKGDMKISDIAYELERTPGAIKHRIKVILGISRKRKSAGIKYVNPRIITSIRYYIKDQKRKTSIEKRFKFVSLDKSSRGKIGSEVSEIIHEKINKTILLLKKKGYDKLEVL